MLGPLAGLDIGDQRPIVYESGEAQYCCPEKVVQPLELWKYETTTRTATSAMPQKQQQQQQHHARHGNRHGPAPEKN